MALPTTIDEVVQRLDGIIASAIQDNSPLGYFPALYREVTLTVDKKTKEGGYFQNDARMRTMVVTFAGRYIEAYDQHTAGQKPTRVWQVAFAAGANHKKLVLQQLTVGINAHINLDLGIAAATVAPGAELPGFKADFDKINDLLFSLVSEMQGRLDKISPRLGWLDKHLGDKDRLFIEWSMEKARDAAWSFANHLAENPAQWNERIELRDVEAELLGKLVVNPGFFIGILLWFIRLKESKDVAGNIKILMGTAS